MTKHTFLFTRTYDNLAEVLTDYKLASLGDAYINFSYSLALSNKKREARGVKVKGSVLAEALRKAGLRENLPARMSRHALADAAEALVVYGWLNGYVALEESVAILEKADDPIEGFSQLLIQTKNRARLS